MKAMTGKVSIAVIDDHPIFRDGVIRVLTGETDFVVVGEGQSADDAIRIAVSQAPDIILLDIGIPGGGLEAARIIQSRSPQIKIMMLTVIQDDRLVRSALGAGAKGYVLKGISGLDLVRTIRKLQNGREGECFVSPALAARIMTRDEVAPPSQGIPSDANTLSDLDRRILLLMSDGHSNQQIAQATGLSLLVIEGEISRIVLHLQSQSRAPVAGPAGGSQRVLH
jgi:two-component system, NarL family, nitrate/nitrite response regulator NarL